MGPVLRILANKGGSERVVVYRAHFVVWRNGVCGPILGDGSETRWHLNVADGMGADLWTMTDTYAIGEPALAPDAQTDLRRAGAVERLREQGYEDVL